MMLFSNHQQTDISQSKHLQKVQSFSPDLVKCFVCTYIYIYLCSILWPATGYPPATLFFPHHLHPPGAAGENRKRKSEKNLWFKIKTVS